MSDDGEENRQRRWAVRAEDTSLIPRKDTEERAREVSVEESRLRMRRQIDLLGDIDDKAMRTVRSAVLILGIGASAIGLGGSSPIRDLAAQTGTRYGLLQCVQWFPTHAEFAIGYGTLSAISLISVVFIGVGVYAVSSLPYGPSEETRMSAFRGKPGAEVEAKVVDRYRSQTNALSPLIKNNANGVIFAQLGLLTGISTLVASAWELVLSAIVSPAWTSLALPILVVGITLAWSLLTSDP